jgi:hypothetical protein
MSTYNYRYIYDDFEESKHPRDESGKFGTGRRATLPSGHKASRETLENGAKRYLVSHPERTDTHYINHSNEGKVTSHQITVPKKVASVKGPRMEEHRTTLSPEESEKKYKKMHQHLREANE